MAANASLGRQRITRPIIESVDRPTQESSDRGRRIASWPSTHTEGASSSSDIYVDPSPTSSSGAPPPTRQSPRAPYQGTIGTGPVGRGVYTRGTPLRRLSASRSAATVGLTRPCKSFLAEVLEDSHKRRDAVLPLRNQARR